MQGTRRCPVPRADADGSDFGELNGSLRLQQVYAALFRDWCTTAEQAPEEGSGAQATDGAEKKPGQIEDVPIARQQEGEPGKPGQEADASGSAAERR